ncbi:hypothetical protein POTOM_027254 [Populus tomentosa]|uniref:Retrovirus-related Pol polyprotein from transposon TNT 1-94-like beta-barrel domain-containing protein n=1 Tax=Populus tomentosa TaxID=118781 RepID=A0A8X7ZED3_POPTO|nr:hypothetical protein POTOM_027254 [Populus tomentosa]
MDENTTFDNAATLNNAVVENSVVAISLVSNSVVAISLVSNSVAAAIMSLAKLFHDILNIEVFAGENFRRWQERIFGVLDMHEIAWVHTDPMTNDNVVPWTHKNKLQGSKGDMETEKMVFLGDSRTANVLGKYKVLLKLILGKTLALNEVLHVPNIRAKLVSMGLLGKFRIKVSFDYDKIVMTKNNVFVGK